MLAIHHELCNDVLLRPKGMREDECRDLHILRDPGGEGIPPTVTSFWYPDPDELARINRGEAVCMTVQGQTHPPLHIGVVEAPDVTPVPKYKGRNPLAKLHPGEPFFIMRARDPFAPAAVMSYACMRDSGGDPSGYAECFGISEAFVQWQRENPDLVKRPD